MKPPAKWRTRERSDLGVCVCVKPTKNKNIFFLKYTFNITIINNIPTIGKQKFHYIVMIIISPSKSYSIENILK